MEDDDFEPITEDDLKEIKKRKIENNDEEEESDMEVESDEEEDDDEDEEEAVVKPELVKDVKKALGKAALPTNVKEMDDDFVSN